MLVVIISKSQDPGANGVVKWLSRWKHDYLRLNTDDDKHQITNLKLTESGFSFEVDGQCIDCEDIKSLWFRKGSLRPKFEFKHSNIENFQILSREINNRQYYEHRKSKEYLLHLMFMRQSRCLGNPLLSDPNKLIVLDFAKNAGLKIAPFSIGQRLDPEQSESPSNYVTKAISDGMYLWDYEDSQKGFFSYTEELSEVLKNRSSTPFPLSFIQKKIDKLYEVRAFFLDGNFYCIAIISQNDPQTSVDYRKYNDEMPNRNIPYELPENIQDKLRNLFSMLNLNTGSVDLIRDCNGDYIFLEINPSGMYGPIISHANVDVNRLIATWLVSE